MSEKELEAEGWDTNLKVTVIVLENGMKIYPSADAEGNGPGELFGAHMDSNFYVTPQGALGL